MDQNRHIITEYALAQLPEGKALFFDDLKDMDGKVRRVVVWSFLDYKTKKYRHAYFDTHTGEYISEKV